jgi:PAS domain S-box-containing protein
LYGGTSSAQREPFAEVARFVCTLLSSAPLGVMVLTSAGRCIAVNAALVTLSLDRLDGTQIQFETPELRTAFLQAVHGEDSLVETEQPPLRLSDTARWRLHFRPFRIMGDRGVALLFERVSDRRHTAEGIASVDERFRLLVDLAGDGIIIHRALSIVYANAEAVRLLAFASPVELVDRPLLELIDAERRSDFETWLREAVAGRAVNPFETTLLRRTGATFPAECHAVHARLDDGGTGFLFFREVMERRRQQSRREAARRIDVLSRLSVSIGAELQSYVTDLRRWISRASSRSPGTADPHSELARLADSMAARADTLMLARMMDVDTDASASSTLEDMVARVCSSLVSAKRVGDRAQDAAVGAGDSSKGLRVDLEPVSYAVRGDPCAIEAGLLVLARTALRTRPRGDGPLCIQGARLPTPTGEATTTYGLSIAGGRVRNAATSCGSELTPPVIERKLDSWEQGRDLELLGAFFSLMSQGCWVDVQCCADGGMRFDVELTLDTGHPVGAGLDDREEPSVARADDSCHQHRPAELEELPVDTVRSQADNEQRRVERTVAPILICDDEARLAALTAGLLREFGFEVITVQSGSEALGAVASHPIDVVILDVSLPGEDAREIVAQLRSRGRVSVILSSGYAEEDIDPALLQDSVVKSFLAKPYGVETLVDTIDRVRLEVRGSGEFANKAGS